MTRGQQTGGWVRPTGGGGGTGNVRWGPQFGNNEQQMFGAQSLIQIGPIRAAGLLSAGCSVKLAAISIDYQMAVGLVLAGQYFITYTELVGAILAGNFNLDYQMAVGNQIAMSAVNIIGTAQVAALIALSQIAIIDLGTIGCQMVMTALNLFGTLSVGCQMGLTYFLFYITNGTYTLAGTNFPGASSLRGDVWGASGGGGTAGSTGGGGGGGGGAYSRTLALAFVPSTDTIKIQVGIPSGTASVRRSWVSLTASEPTTTTEGIMAQGGGLGGNGTTSQGAGGIAGAATGIGVDAKIAGGAGGGGGGVGTLNGGGGGGGAGSTNPGTAGNSNGTKGNGGTPNGGDGGAGASGGTPATQPQARSGGGGGASTLAARTVGRDGEVRITVVAA